MSGGPSSGLPVSIARLQKIVNQVREWVDDADAVLHAARRWAGLPSPEPKEEEGEK